MSVVRNNKKRVTLVRVVDLVIGKRESEGTGSSPTYYLLCERGFLTGAT